MLNQYNQIVLPYPHPTKHFSTHPHQQMTQAKSLPFDQLNHTQRIVLTCLLLISCLLLHYDINLQKMSIDHEGAKSKDSLSIAARRAQQQERRKPILLRQLENQLRHLDDIEDREFPPDEDPCLHDQTLERLQLIAREANKLQIRQIQKLCRLAIGKRILNIELKKKKDEHSSKMKKKEKIELFFRENRIKRIDYAALRDQKLAKDTLIARPYDNGKGFVQSDRFYGEEHGRALTECRYSATVREVNKMFYRNYSGGAREDVVVETLLKAAWLPIGVLVGLGFSLPLVSFPYEEILLAVLLSVVLALLGVASLRTYLEKPTKNNQIQQTVLDVQSYFATLNLQLALAGKEIEWSCDPDFMYLQAIFHRGLL